MMRRLRLITALLILLSVLGLASCDPVAIKGRMWASPQEVAVLPTSGQAWDLVRQTAYGDWGTPSLSDNNSTHDTSVLAGALVAARTGDPALTAKTRAALMSVTRITSYNRVLELARNITSYVVAADIVGLPVNDDASFKWFIANLRGKPLTGHSGGDNLESTALRSPNNWGTMSRAATVAIDLYIGDDAQLAALAQTHRAWLGENVASSLSYSSTAWHADPAHRAGIDRRGTAVLGRNVDGVLPEDQRRSGEPTTSAPLEGSYPWEALQGALVAGVLLDRAGLVPINAGDDALARASTWLFETNQNPPSNDDRWQTWLLNRTAGTRFPTEYSGGPGKNMGFTDWTHAPAA